MARMLRQLICPVMFMLQIIASQLKEHIIILGILGAMGSIIIIIFPQQEVMLLMMLIVFILPLAIILITTEL